MEELERLSQRDDAGSYLTIYKTTTFDVTDESCEVYNTDLLQSLITKQIVVVFQIKKTPYTFVSQ